MKTIERAHSPAHMWERIKLSNSYSKVLEQVSLVSSLFASHSVYSPDRQRTFTLAKFHNPQMQATGYEDHPISHKDASAEIAPTVSAIFSSFNHILKLSGQNSLASRKNSIDERLSENAKHCLPHILNVR